MSRKARVLTNIRNAAFSTGPKTEAGRSRTSRNALKHGLNVNVRHEPGVSVKIETLAVAIAGENATVQRLWAAQSLAEAFFELDRIRKFKLTLIKDAADKLRIGELGDR